MVVYRLFIIPCFMVNSKVYYHFKVCVNCLPEPFVSTPNHFSSKIVLLPFPLSAQLSAPSTNHTWYKKLLHSICHNFTQCAACTAHVNLLAFFTLTYLTHNKHKNIIFPIAFITSCPSTTNIFRPPI